jgi:hypothetical protein
MDKKWENTIYGVLTGAILCSEVLPMGLDEPDNFHIEQDPLGKTLKYSPVFLAPLNVLEPNNRPAAAGQRSLAAETLVDLNAFSMTPELSPYHWE